MQKNPGAQYRDPRHPATWPLWQQYVLSIGAVLLSLLVRHLLDPYLKDKVPFTFTISALLILVLVVRPLPFLAAAALGCLGARYFFMVPRYTLELEEQSQAITFGAFIFAIGAACFAAWISGKFQARAREAHRRSENDRETLDVTLRGIQDGVIATDVDGRVSFMNAVGSELTGWASAEAVGRPLSEVFRVIDELSGQPIARVAPIRGEAGAGELRLSRLHRRGGGETRIEDRSSPLRGPGGEVVGTVLVFRDVSERMRALESLRQSEARKSAILESALDCIITMDAEGRIVDFNPAAERTFGYAKGEVVGRTVAETIIPPKHRQAHEAGMRRYFDTGEGAVLGRRIEITGLRSDGVEFPVELAVVATRTPGLSSGTFFTAYLRDLRERNAARDAIRTGEEQYKSLVDQVKDYAIFRIDLEGRAATWNQGVKRVLGYDEAEFLELTGEALFVPEDIQAGVPARELEHALATGHANNDRWMRRKDGTRFWAMGMTSAIRDEQGRPIGFTKVMRDQTDWKRAEEERDALLASERAARSEVERSSRLKDEFVATLSHELRTPLNAILGWAQLLRKGPSNTDDLSSGLETIERNARVQSRMIEDLLDMSRIISGKLRLDVQRVDVADVVKASIESIRPATEAKQIRVQAVLDPRTNIVSGDPSRLQQIVWNLLSNAVKFTPKGGKIQVVLQRVKSHVEIVVTDSGRGIRPEFIDSVFDRFRQEDATTTRKFGGLGLGLSIVKQLVEMHGGTVRVASAGEGLGATFTVELPLRMLTHSRGMPDEERVQPVTPKEYDKDCPKLKGVRILVVDDEPDSRAIVQRLLEDCEAVVSVAGSVVEAMKLFRERRPHVLLSDIGMPEKDGYELVRWVRSLPADQGGQTPAAALTALARSEDRTRALLAGYQLHIAKPIEPSELIAVAVSLASLSTYRGGESNGAAATGAAGDARTGGGVI